MHVRSYLAERLDERDLDVRMPCLIYVPHKKNTRGRFVTVEITLKTVENVRNQLENSHGIDNRVPRI